MLVFAYDGSLHGDWVAHYAVRFAANTKERRLRLVHVHDGAPEAHLGERLARVVAEGKVVGVEVESELVPGRRGHVAERLRELVPEGATLVAGTRARPRGGGLLAGTVSAKLLEAAHFPVIALHVAHPGVLGQPGRVLLPLSGRPGPVEDVVPLLRLLGRDLHHLHVLFVRELSHLRFRLLGAEAAERLLAEGRAFLAPIEDALREAVPHPPFALDSTAVLSDDTPREILLHARRHRARLICLAASRRTLPHRLVYGSPIELVLRGAPADVAIYRGAPGSPSWSPP